MALKKFVISIQSFSDVITNSSSSVFLLNSNQYTLETVESILLPVAKENWDRSAVLREEMWDQGKMMEYDNIIYEDSLSDNPQYDDWSGDAGELDIYINEDGNIVICIDHSRYATIKFIRDTFKIDDRW